MPRDDIFKKCFIAKIAKEFDSHVIMTKNQHASLQIFESVGWCWGVLLMQRLLSYAMIIHVYIDTVKDKS